MNVTEQVKRWEGLESYDSLLRQIHLDICVGSKNGVCVQELKETLKAFTDNIYYSVVWESFKPNYKDVDIDKLLPYGQRPW